MIIRRIIGWLLLALTVLVYVLIGTDGDYAVGYYSMADDFYIFAGLWLGWAFVVLLMVRRELPLGFGRFFLRMLGIDK